MDDRERLHSLRQGRPARVHDREDLADAVVQGHALGRRDRRPRRLPAFAEGTVAMTSDTTAPRVVLRRAHRPAAASRCTAQVTSQRLAAAASEPQNWLTYSGNYSSTRYSPLDADHAGQRQEPEAAVGVSVAGGRQLADDAARRRRRHVPHPAPERRRRARRGDRPRVLDLSLHAGRGPHRLLRREQPRPRDPRQHAVHGHARRAARSRSTPRAGGSSGRPRWRAPKPATR